MDTVILNNPAPCSIPELKQRDEGIQGPRWVGSVNPADLELGTRHKTLDQVGVSGRTDSLELLKNGIVSSDITYGL
jgi:hypothetical protein